METNINMKLKNENGAVVDVHPDLQYEVDKQLQNNNHEGITKILKQNSKPKTVSELYTEKTGKAWKTAKSEGLTDGSYANNIKLRQKLIQGDFDKKGEEEAGYEIYQKGGKYSSRKVYTQDEIEKSLTFNDAFKKARDSYGKNNVFIYNGKKFTTNKAGEKFEPTEDVITKNNLDYKHIEKQNKQVESPYTSKEVTKLNKEGYKNVESLKRRKQEIAKMKNADKINAYYSDNKIKGKYIIVDKKAGRYHIYENGKLLDSYEGIMGANESDEQTKTFVKNGKVDWSKGNKSTGMGEYTISNVDPSSEHYYGAPSFNLINSKGIKVPTTFHGTPYSRRKSFNNESLTNRMSNGCINGKCKDLKEMYSVHKINKGTKVYILPEEEGNTVSVDTDGIRFNASADNKKKYTMAGANVTTNKYYNRQHVRNYQQQLYDKGYLIGDKSKVVDGMWGKNTQVAYDKAKKDGFDPIQKEYDNTVKPIKLFIDKTSFEKNVYSTFDFNDDKEFNETTKPFINTLQKERVNIMKLTGVSNDAYNEIIKVAFGIYGTESNFGDTHSAIGNLGRAARKYFNPSSSSSPDTKSKSTTYGANSVENSVGLTQLRWKWVERNPKLLNTLKKAGITSNKDLNNPIVSAKATTIILIDYYNNQLTQEQKKDIMKYLPATWNKRSNYASRVKKNSKNSRYLSIKQRI